MPHVRLLSLSFEFVIFDVEVDQSLLTCGFWSGLQMLGSAYILGALPEQLKDMYDVECKKLEPWPDSPGEVARHDWRKHLGDKRWTADITIHSDR